MEITRRDLVGSAAAVAATAVIAPSAIAFADDADEFASLANELNAHGGTSMSIEELNLLRKKYVDETEEWTCADGTVIPAVYTKLRALTKTYSFGLGAATADDSFDFYIKNFTEDEAAAYLEMPMGVTFTAAEYAQTSGRDETECSALCEELSRRGLLYRTVRAGVPNYNQIAVMHGMIEYNLDNYTDDNHAVSDYFMSFVPVRTDGWMEDMMDSGTPFYRCIPVEKDVLGEAQVLPLDDWRAIIDRNDVIGVSPCQCRRPAMALAGYDVPDVNDPALIDYRDPVYGHPMETCMTFGEEAEYYIWKGIARQITKEEAVAIIERSIDDGLAIQSMYTRDSEVICQCHGDTCAVLSTYIAMGPDYAAKCSSYPKVSDYVLEHDAASCLKCGKCAERCPMTCISMDGPDGIPVANALCVSCGQCTLVCPASARKLIAKPEKERGVIPKSLLDGYNTLAAWRFENGKIVH